MNVCAHPVQFGTGIMYYMYVLCGHIEDTKHENATGSFHLFLHRTLYYVLVLSFATQVVQVQYLYRLPVHMYVIFSNFYTIPVTFPGLYFLTFLLSFPPLILERCCFCDFVALLDALILLACG